MLLLPSTMQSGEKRYALVIGNKDYKVGPLPNAGNDANDLAELLKQKSFEVQKVIDGTRLEMRNAIRDFANKLVSAVWAYFIIQVMACRLMVIIF